MYCDSKRSRVASFGLLLAFDFLAKITSSFDEAWVRNDASIGPACHTLKPVKVELASETLIFTLIEVDRKYFCDEFFVVVYFECLSVLYP